MFRGLLTVLALALPTQSFAVINQQVRDACQSEYLTYCFGMTIPSEPLRACFTNFNLQFFLSYMAPKLKLKVVEIPVSRVYPGNKTVPTKVVGFRRNFLVFWEMVLTVRGKYDPPA